MDSVTRRSVLASAAGAAAFGMAGQLVGQERQEQDDDKSRGAGAMGKDCLCVILIPDLDVDGLGSRGESESRDPVSALIGALVPVLVDEIIKATRSRSAVTATARSIDLQQLAAKRNGERGADEKAMRGLFSGSVSAPGIKIGVVLG